MRFVASVVRLGVRTRPASPSRKPPLVGRRSCAGFVRGMLISSNWSPRSPLMRVLVKRACIKDACLRSADQAIHYESKSRSRTAKLTRPTPPPPSRSCASLRMLSFPKRGSRDWTALNVKGHAVRALPSEQCSSTHTKCLPPLLSFRLS